MRTTTKSTEPWWTNFLLNSKLGTYVSSSCQSQQTLQRIDTVHQLDLEGTGTTRSKGPECEEEVFDNLGLVLNPLHWLIWIQLENFNFQHTFQHTEVVARPMRTLEGNTPNPKNHKRDGILTPTSQQLYGLRVTPWMHQFAWGCGPNCLPWLYRF